MSSLEKKLKHLDFIQLTITRMAANSFLLKAWSVTLVAALFALVAKNTGHKYAAISFVPVLLFWILDAYYLRQEKLYRKLYDDIRKRDESDIDFSLNTADYIQYVPSWAGVMFTKTLLLFYGVLLIMVIILYGVI